jgi:adenylate kinase
MSKIIVLMGAPGAGKGTQARLLQERLNLPQISTGDLFRALKGSHTPLAQEVRAIMEKGQLVPDELTIALVRDRTSQPDCANGYILDGYPRTTAQAASLKLLAEEQHNEITAVLISSDFQLIEKRMTGRRSCPVCGEIYNMYFKAPKTDSLCDFHPEAQLIHRSDDNAETVRARLATYDEQTRPLVDYYRNTGLLRRVDGTRDAEEIYRDIENIVKN